MDKSTLKQNLKIHLIKYLNILDYQPEDIADDMPLFGSEGLQLDSIDSLELTVMLEREYGVKITNPSDGRKILKDVESMANYIIENSKK
jgi:acyl carrier protein